MKIFEFVYLDLSNSKKIWCWANDIWNANFNSSEDSFQTSTVSNEKLHKLHVLNELSLVFK